MSHSIDHRSPITDHRSPDARAGFSLLEVLVATTVLVVIVIMIASVFQQSKLAWQGGTRRAEGVSAMRTALGFMAREMSQAVDARGLTNLLASGDNVQRFSPSEVEFVTLGGTNRSPLRIRYTIAGGKITRFESALKATANPAWGTEAASILVEPPPNRQEHSTMALQYVFNVVYADADKPVQASDPPLPLYVEIKASLARTFEQRDVMAGSAGPDKTFGTSDDVPYKMPK